MQRYHNAASCTSAVNNSGIGCHSSRDSGRPDSNSNSNSLSSNFSLNSRRASPLVAYKLKCEKESLNSRLGPPDFQSQTPNCPEETLTKEYVQSGYRETIEGLEEAKEISVTQVNIFTKPVVLKCKEAIRKRLRAINESRALKRKAGQVYGEPLSGSLLSKPGVFPELKPCSEDFKKRWIEGLSQCNKSLRSLADLVPQGYRKKSLFEILIRNNVPLLRATWFIKVNYLNQFRPSSSGTCDKIYLTRTEQWTKDVTDYLQGLLDQLVARNNSQSIPHNRNRSSQMMYGGSVLHKSEAASAMVDAEEPSLQFKWWYVVRILHWHLAQGLILPYQVMDWIFLQFQDTDLLEVMPFLLPIIYGLLETIILCQTYVRKLVVVALHYLKKSSSSGSNLVDYSQKSYISTALVEMIQYLILLVPDTFVALDCFPLPSCLVMPPKDSGRVFPKLSPDAENLINGSFGVPHMKLDKHNGVKFSSSCLNRVVSSIQKCAKSLSQAASPGYPGQNVAKAVQALDKALLHGDILEAYQFLFEDQSDSSVGESWVAEVSSCLKSSLKWIGSVDPSLIYSVFLLCEWCTCDFRDCRTTLSDVKFTGRKDFSQLLVGARLVKLKIREIQREEKAKGGTERILWDNYQRKLNSSLETSDLFESPGPLHDIIVCWLDQHDAQKGEGFKRVQLLLMEFISSGIFSPQAYMRQLLVSGIMDKTGSLIDLNRQKRHYKIVKQLPSSCMRDVFSETRIADTPILLEAVHVYTNDRRLLLRGLLGDESKILRNHNSSLKQKEQKLSQEKLSASSLYHLKLFTSSSSSSFPGSKRKKNDAKFGRLKNFISELLRLPMTCTPVVVDESVVSMKRSAVSPPIQAIPGCEECHRAKRQKLGDETYSFSQVSLPYPSDDDNSWWMRKEPKPIEVSKGDPPVKPSKLPSRGRQKIVRKTQSLNQLAASRIEGSQGASTSHVCDSKMTCPHHHPMLEGDAPKSTNSVDLFTIGKLLKRLKCLEKRSISVWLVSSVKEVIEETERNNTKVGQHNRSSACIDEKSSMRWKLGENELSVILYLMDICIDLPSAIRFLIWLLPKAHGGVSTSIHGGRNVMVFPRNSDSHAWEVREPFVLSSIRRYENILIAADLIPELLSAAMNRAAAVVASNGRLSGSPTFLYARYLMNKYASIRSVVEWERSFKASCDKRLLSEFESVRLQNGELGFSFAIPPGVNDLDDFIRQKIGVNKLSRPGIAMRDAVQEKVNLAFQCLFNKERKLFGASAQKNAGIEKWDDGYQIAQQIVGKLMDEMRPLAGALQEGDLSLVACAVSAIVGSVGPAIAKMPDFTAVSNHHSNSPAPTGGSLGFARRVLRVHIDSLCLLKEALGERHSRAFEIALATEASSALAGVLPHKGSRAQLQLLSPEGHGHESTNVNMSSDVPNNSTKVAVGRATKTAAAVSALIIGALIHGVASLERMVTAFRVRENLDLMQFVRSFRSHGNGNARSVGGFKTENALEVYIHLFRLLVGNCRSICDGVIVELLGEPSVVALSRMQRTLPLKLVLPPAYSLFAFFIWRPYILGIAMGNREEIPQWFQSLMMALGDAVKHSPFRDICMRNIHSFFDMVNSDATDSEFASFLELSGSDRHFKARDFVPLRSRLFLNALIDCKLPNSVPLKDERSRLSGNNDSTFQDTETKAKIVDRVVNALDTLQPAKFHWQWIELRLLLNEQTLIEKLDSSGSIAEAILSLASHSEKDGSSENENNFIPIVLTRLVVRPDAAPLLAELLHLFGRSWEDSLLSHIRWFLDGHDVLFGRKSILHRLKNLAEDNRFSTKTRFWKHWGWSQSSSDDPMLNRGDQRRCEGMFVEEEEVVEADNKRRHVGAAKVLLDHDGLDNNREFVTDRAFVELVLPCIDRTCDDSRNRCASELIKQMNNIAQQINRMTCPSSKQLGQSNMGTEGLTNKSNRKGMKGGSPGMPRRASISAVDSSPVSPLALRASLSLRLQLLVRLLPTICAEGDPSSRSLRFMLASVILRLLGSRLVYEDMYLTHYPGHGLSLKEAELQMETSAAISLDLSGKNVFNWLLLVFHALLGSSQPSWLRLKSSSKSNVTLTFSGFDREILEGFQNELDQMQLPETVRQRIQAVMPILPRNPQTHIPCHLTSVSSTALVSLQGNTTISAAPSQKNLSTSVRTTPANSVMVKSKAATTTTSQADNNDVEIDPWLALEDGAGSEPCSVNTTSVMGGSDPANLKATSLLKGAIRVRRTDLTYIPSVGDDT